MSGKCVLVETGMTLTQIGQKIAYAVVDNGGTDENTKTVLSDEGLAKNIALLILGKAELVVKAVIVDPIIRVDRSIRPVYPDWVKTVMHPELENTGPAEYDGSKLDQWLHPDQKNFVQGNAIYDYLNDKNLLSGCLGLRDLEEIQKKGIAFFRQNFQGKAVFAWKSVVRRRGGNLNVPYLCGFGGVVVHWYWLGNDWYAGDPALRFAS